MARYRFAETLSVDVPIRVKDADGKDVPSVGCRLFRAGDVIDEKDVLAGSLASMLRLKQLVPLEAGLKESAAKK